MENLKDDINTNIAWMSDGSDVNFKYINLNQLDDYLVRNQNIQDFLSHKTNKMFIVAPKGVGKTYILHIKSKLFKSKHSGFKYIPSDGSLVEKFISNNLTFSYDDVSKYQDERIWIELWELCIYTAILRTFKSKELPDDINNIIGKYASTVGEILNIFLQNRNSINRLYEYVATDLKPLIRKLSEESEANQVAIFLDSVDEVLDPYGSSQIWVQSQTALMKVAKDICDINKHVKIFLSIRSEAYNLYRHSTKGQLDAKCLFLGYTKGEIKEIFLKNIKLSSDSQLSDPVNVSVLARITGFDKIRHKFVKDKNDKESFQIEDFFDFIYRHTFARPRDIIKMGEALVNMTDSERRDTKSVGSVVNAVSMRLFAEQLRNEVVPPFDEEKFSIFCKIVHHNVIKHIDCTPQLLELLPYHYNLGLVGIVENVLDQQGTYLRQAFLEVGQHSLEKGMPPSTYYFIHPALNKIITTTQNIRMSYYNTSNIIGYGYNFTPDNIELDYHFHFGLDRDSTGIVIPEIEYAKRIAIVVKPHNHLHDLKLHENDYFILESGGKNIAFRVFHDNLTEKVKNDIKLDWANRKYHVLLYTDSVDEIAGFFSTVKTISLCIASPYIDIITKLLSTLSNDYIVYIYYCLRVYIEDKFSKFKNSLSSKSSVIIEPVLIDRFVYNDELIDEDIDNIKQIRYKINAENEGKLIFKSRRESHLRQSNIIHMVHSDQEMQLHIYIQNYLLEGLYQFYRLLQSAVSVEEDIKQNILKEFAKIQVSRILKNFDTDEIQSFFHGKTKYQIQEDFIENSKKLLERLFNLFKRLNNKNKINIEENKSFEIFPDDKTLFTLIKNSDKYYSETDTFYFLIDLLEAKPLDEYHTVFISYSTKDSEIVDFFYKRLRIKGIDVKMFSMDNPEGSFQAFMDENIRKNSKMLFVSSENSLSSDPCHYELSNCIELMRKNNSISKLIAIRLDNTLLTLTDADLALDEVRKKNIKTLRERINVNKYDVDFNNALGQQKIDEKLSSLIDKALKK